MRENSAYKTKSGLRISKSLVLLTVLLMPFFRPNGINWVAPGGQYIYDALSMASFGILLIIYLSRRFQILYSQLIIAGIMFLVIMVSTFRGDGDIMVHIRITVTCLGMMLAVFIFRETPRLLISALLLNTEILIYINTLCLLLFPGGMYLSHVTYGASNNWFMGYDNHWFVFYYGAYFLAIANILYGGSKWRSYLLFLVLHVTALFTFSGVLVVGLFLMDVMFFFRIYQMKLFNFKTIFAGGILLTVALVFFQTNETIQYVIANILSKSDSMSARARIWRGAIARIMGNPVWGNGRFFTEDAMIMYGLPAAVNAHNMWLEILVEGGIVGFAAFISFMVFAIKKSDKDQSPFYKTLLIPIAASLVMMSVDSMIETRGVMFFALMSIAYNSSYYEAAVVEEAARPFESSQLRIDPGLWVGKLRSALVYARLYR